jgi:Cys-rich repeat protein
MRWILVAALAGLMGCGGVEPECSEPPDGFVVEPFCWHAEFGVGAVCVDDDGRRVAEGFATCPAVGAAPVCATEEARPACGECATDADCASGETCEADADPLRLPRCITASLAATSEG